MIDLDELKRLAGLVTPGEWAYRPDEYDDWGLVKTEPREVGNYEPPFILRGVIGQFRDPDVRGEEALNQHRKAGTDPWETNARLIVTLRNALPELITALEIAALVRSVPHAVPAAKLDEVAASAVDWGGSDIPENEPAKWETEAGVIRDMVAEIRAYRAIIAALPKEEV